MPVRHLHGYFKTMSVQISCPFFNWVVLFVSVLNISLINNLPHVEFSTSYKKLELDTVFKLLLMYTLYWRKKTTFTVNISGRGALPFACLFSFSLPITTPIFKKNLFSLPFHSVFPYYCPTVCTGLKVSHAHFLALVHPLGEENSLYPFSSPPTFAKLVTFLSGLLQEIVYYCPSNAPKIYT